MTAMKVWERPHVPAFRDVDLIYHRGKSYPVSKGDCYYCRTKNADHSSPCPARTVRLSENPQAVKMLRAFGGQYRKVKDTLDEMKASGHPVKFPAWVPYNKAAQQLIRAIAAAVRAAFEYEPKGG